MRLRRVMILAALIMLALYCLRFQWLPPLASWLNVSDPRLPVRYVLPLPGGNDRRPFAAAAIVRAGLADQAVVLKNEATPDSEDGIVMPMHEVTREVLLKRGVATNRILMLEGESQNTMTDLQIISGIWDQDPDATMAIVTDPAHTRRARWVADRVLQNAGKRICVIAATNDSYDDRVWWQSEEGVNAIASEYLKLAFYLVRYSSPGKRLASIVTFLGLGFAIVWLRRRRLPELSLANSASISSTNIDV